MAPATTTPSTPTSKARPGDQVRTRSEAQRSSATSGAFRGADMAQYGECARALSTPARRAGRVRPDPPAMAGPGPERSSLEGVAQADVVVAAQEIVEGGVRVGERRGVHVLRLLVEDVVDADRQRRLAGRGHEPVAAVDVDHDVGAHLAGRRRRVGIAQPTRGNVVAGVGIPGGALLEAADVADHGAGVPGS